MKKYIFWHIGNIGNGIEVAKEQYQTLLDSGLLQNIDCLNIGLSGDADEFINSILNEKTKLVVHAPIGDCETQTSRKMLEFARSLSEDSYVLYMHTKGCSKYGTPLYENGRAWRRYMEYFSIKKWRDSIAKLDSGYDSCGVELFYDPRPGMHYSGAFFWMRTSILKQIDPSLMSMGSTWGQFCTEAIPSIIEHKRFCFFSYRDTNPNIDLYLYESKPKDYIKMNLTEIKDYILLQGSESIPVCGGNFEGGIYLQQYPDEIAEVLNYLLQAKPKYNNMLEVGSAAGGNSKVFSEILSIPKLYIVDDNNHPRHGFRPATLKGLDYIEYIGNSQAQEAKDWINNLNTKFDIVYIDADHSFDGLYKDMQNFVQFVAKDGYVILHDTLVCEGVVRAAAKAGEFGLKEVFSSKHKLGITLFQLNEQ